METQEEKLSQEILAEAKKRADRILARAKSDISGDEKRAASANAKLREERLAAAQTSGGYKHRTIVQGVWGEKRKMWLSEREACLEQFFAELVNAAVNTASDDPRRSASLAALAAAGINSLAEPSVIIKVNSADARLLTPAQILKALPAELQSVEIAFQTDDSISGGVLLATADGSRTYDNTYEGRLHRLREDFRKVIAGELPAEVL